MPVMARLADEPVLERDTFNGTLSSGDVSAPIIFDLHAGSDSRLVFDVAPGSKELGLLAMRNMGTPGETVPYFTLNASSATGKSLASDTVSATQSVFNDEGYTLGITTNAATLGLPIEERANRPLLRIWFRSFRSFRTRVFETPLGQFETFGATNISSPDELSGYVAVQAPDGFDPDGWRDEAHRFLMHMHSGLALAHGGGLQVARVDYINEHTWTADFYAGSASRPEFAVQHQLNHEPIIQALIDRYFKDGPVPPVLWTALGWMHSETTYDEVRFLTAMTALETIIESELPQKRGTTVTRSVFKSVQGELANVLSARTDLTQDEKEAFQSRIAGINRKSFVEKINALFDHYSLSRQDFDAQSIKQLVDLRNEIVHRGRIPAGIDAWPKIILVREIIVRILLSVIGFKGGYCCYIGGQHDRDFP
jgi:hypothetical protein